MPNLKSSGTDASGNIEVSTAAAEIRGTNTNAPAIKNEASSGTNPTLLPDRADATAGIGGTSGEVSLITGGVEAINVDTSQRSTLEGFLSFGTPTELTVASGVITATRTFHTVDTENDDATDSLDTINGGTTGDILLLRGANASRDVTVKHLTGNIIISGGADFTLANASSSICLLYDGTNWRMLFTAT